VGNDVSPRFPSPRSKALGCRHAHHEDYSWFGRAPTLHLANFCHPPCEDFSKRRVEGHHPTRREAVLTRTCAAARQTGWGCVMRQVLSYIRVSTGKQGKSGLGIEAQREAIARFATAEGFEIVAEYVEVETGKGADALDRRPKLAAALAAARKTKAPVVVAKL